MPDMFSRFGDEMPIPGRLKIITRGEGNNEEVIQVVHEKIARLIDCRVIG